MHQENRSVGLTVAWTVTACNDGEVSLSAAVSSRCCDHGQHTLWGTGNYVLRSFTLLWVFGGFIYFTLASLLLDSMMWKPNQVNLFFVVVVSTPCPAAHLYFWCNFSPSCLHSMWDCLLSGGRQRLFFSPPPSPPRNSQLLLILLTSVERCMQRTPMAENRYNILEYTFQGDHKKRRFGNSKS